MAKLKNVESELYEDAKSAEGIKFNYTLQKQLGRVAEVSSSPTSRGMLPVFKNCLRTLHNLLSPYENERFKKKYEALEETIKKTPEMVGDVEKVHDALMEYYRALVMLMDEEGLLNEREGSELI